MNVKISVVINTLNEERNIEQAIKSVKWADEIIVCDMHSEDNTVEIAKKHGARIFFHKREDYVEPARNFALSKISNDWILVLDPDEEISEGLANRLQEIADSMEQIDYVRLPRKNIIFGHFMRASMWWPDYNIRFFKKGKVKWGNLIHRPPKVVGEGLDLSAEEKWAIIHNHYQSISQFLERMSRYTKIQAQELIDTGYSFEWKDLIKKPLSEFLGRFFANKGFNDGVHGLILSLLQALSLLIVYIRVWENEKFQPKEIIFDEIKVLTSQSGKELDYWIKYGNLSSNPFKRLLQKAKNKI